MSQTVTDWVTDYEWQTVDQARGESVEVGVMMNAVCLAVLVSTRSD